MYCVLLYVAQCDFSMMINMSSLFQRLSLDLQLLSFRFVATRLNCCTTHLLARKWGHMYNIQQSYHNEHTHFCREMCNIVNTRFLRPFGVITEITTKSP